MKCDDVEALKNQAALLVEIAPNLGLWLDYSIEGLKAVDEYFDQRIVDGVAKEGSLFEAQGDRLLFCFGAYVGEVILRAGPGARWCLDEEAGEDLSQAYVHQAEKDFGAFPFNKVLKRFQNGPEDSLYSFADLAVKAIRGEIDFGAEQ
jgi:hypothetical protein